jgi:hypothetical protein
MELKRFVYSKAIWNISRTSDIFYGHLVIFPRFGIMSQEKSGNPAQAAGQYEDAIPFLD